MVQRLIPGLWYIDETGLGQRLIPGAGYVDESVSGGGAGNAAPTFPGPNIGNLSGTVGTALTSNNVASKFSDTDALTFTAIGTWPPGVTVSSAGVISGTPTTDGTYANLKVRATDTAAQTVDSDTFSFTISAGGTQTLSVTDSAHTHAADNLVLGVIGTLAIADAAHAHTADSITLTATTNGTITIPAVRDWETGNLKTNQSGVQVDIRNISTGALVVRKAGQTTHATTGVCIVTDAAIIAGTTYEVVTRFADGSKGMWDYAAT